MLTASLAESRGARVVATFECWYGCWVPIWASRIKSWMHVRGCLSCCCRRWRRWARSWVERVDLGLGRRGWGVGRSCWMVDCLHYVGCGWSWCRSCVVGRGRWRRSLLSLKRTVDGLADHVDEYSLLIEKTVLTLLLLLLLVSLTLFRSVVLPDWRRWGWCRSWRRYYDWCRCWDWHRNRGRCCHCRNCWGWACDLRRLVAAHEL